MDFGLVRLGESCVREIPLKNTSNIPVHWVIDECIDCCLGRVLTVRNLAVRNTIKVLYRESCQLPEERIHFVFRICLWLICLDDSRAF